MAIEGEDQRMGVMPLGVGNSLADNLLVAEMHTIEKAHRQADLAVPRLKFMRCADDVHAAM